MSLVDKGCDIEKAIWYFVFNSYFRIDIVITKYIECLFQNIDILVQIGDFKQFFELDTLTDKDTTEVKNNWKKGDQNGN